MVFGAIVLLSRQYYYYYLTDEGIDYLREYLALPSTVAPETTKKPASTARPTRGAGDRFNKREGGRPDFVCDLLAVPRSLTHTQKRRDDGYRRDTGGFGRGRA